jgi:hypothetical protein
MGLLETTVIPALVGAAVSFAGALITSAVAARSRIDDQLRSTRIHVYKPLWRATKRLPKWPRATGVTRGDMYQLSVELRDWYFDMAGMYLSNRSMRAYRELQGEITLVAKPDDKTALTDLEYDKVRDACSHMRSELTADLVSRSRGLVFG